MGAQYLDGFLVGGRTWGEVTGFNDNAWKAGVTVDHALTSNLDVKLNVQYESYDYGIAKTDGWAGFLRFESTF